MINGINKNNEDIVNGIKVFVQIDVQFCRTAQMRHNRNILCFSEMESVAAYLGAASAKNIIEDVCFKINAAEAIVYKPSNASAETANYFWTILASAFVLLVCMVIVVQVTNRKRKFICAPIFRPSYLAQSKIYFKL